MRRRTTHLFALAAAVLHPFGLDAQVRTDPVEVWIPAEDEIQELVLTDGAELVGIAQQDHPRNIDAGRKEIAHEFEIDHRSFIDDDNFRFERPQPDAAEGIRSRLCE